MTDDGSPSPTIRGLIWKSAQDASPYGGTLAAGLLGAGGFFVDLFSLAIRITLFAVALFFALVGIAGIRHRAQRERTDADRTRAANAEVNRLKAQLRDSAPETFLEVVGTAIFVRPGGWRLTLFVVDQMDDGWWLKPLIASASSEVFEASPHGRLLLSKSRLREVLDVDASDPLHPVSNEASNLPSRDVDPDEWQRLRSLLIPDDPDEFCMPTRKFGWTVTKEPASRRTLVLLSESVLSDGIRMDVVRSQLLAPTIAMVARMSGIVDSDADLVQ